MGCSPQRIRPLRICPGKNSVTSAINSVNSRSEGTLPFKAAGDCSYFYEVNGKIRHEQLRLTMRVEPPDKIYVQGASIIGKAVVLGSNEHEFWLQLTPKEISTYIWGEWNDENVKECASNLWLGPGVWLEAFGIIQISSTGSGSWELSNEGPYDILSQKDAAGVLRKKVYIYSCDYRVRKIEYFDRQGNKSAVTELDKYTPIVNGSDWMVPRILNITSGGAEKISVELTKVTDANFTEKQRKLLFKRPLPIGFEYIKKINSECEFEEENQI